jgi:hypothetical protein
MLSLTFSAMAWQGGSQKLTVNFTMRSINFTISLASLHIDHDAGTCAGLRDRDRDRLRALDIGGRRTSNAAQKCC